MNKRYFTSLKLAALAVAGLVLGSAATSRAQTAPPSPVGDWDIVSSGKEQGLVLLNFVQEDYFGGSLSGYKLVRPVPRKAPSKPDGDARGVGEPDRNGLGGTGGSSSSSTSTNFLGGANIEGQWAYDSSGKLIGFYDQVSEFEIKPVEEISTNVVDGFIILTTNIVYKGVMSTNSVSFRGTVVAGSKITIYTYGPQGNNTLKGKPLTNLGNLGGGFYSVGKRGSLNFIEFLDLTQGIPNTFYGVEGDGAGYAFSGAALVSNQKKIAVLTLSGNVLSVYTGSFNLSTRKGKISGVDSFGQKLTYNLSPLP